MGMCSLKFAECFQWHVQCVIGCVQTKFRDTITYAITSYCIIFRVSKQDRKFSVSSVDLQLVTCFLAAWQMTSVTKKQKASMDTCLLAQFIYVLTS